MDKFTWTEHGPTNTEMQAYSLASRKRKRQLCESVGCCGTFDSEAPAAIEGSPHICKLTQQPCRLVVEAAKLLKSTRGFRWE